MDVFYDPEVSKALAGLITALITVLIAAVGVIINKLNLVKKQVQNDHDTNLRDDVTASIDNVNDVRNLVSQNSKDIESLADAVKSGFKAQDKRQDELHTFIRQEVEDRQSLERASLDERRRIWSAIECAKRKIGDGVHPGITSS